MDKINYHPEFNDFAGSLGISVQRERELCDIVDEVYESTDTYPQAICELSVQVTENAEFAYCLFHLGAFAGSNHAKKEMIEKLSE